MLIFSHPVHENASFCGRPHEFPACHPRKRHFLWTAPKLYKKKQLPSDSCLLSGYCDSNTGPSGPKPDALANCATPRVPSFGTANIRRKNKSAKFFDKILHFLLFRFPIRSGMTVATSGMTGHCVGNDGCDIGNDGCDVGKTGTVIAGLTGYLRD